MRYTDLDSFLRDLPEHARRHEQQLRGHDMRVRVETMQGRRVTLTLRDGVVTTSESDDAPVTCTVRADERHLLDMINGKLHPMKALLLQKIVIKGDPTGLIALARMI